MKKKKGMNLVEVALLCCVVFVITYYGINYLTDFLSEMFGANQDTQIFTKSNTRTQIDPLD